ncbi:hypothetical protein [Curtobacterium sp. MCPF17_031]|uniref:hypothetical protein n=1 Tax=Curtobacterium sp. MCPF17_031 TaxID=2175653 RepID=UPI0011B66D6E|nr:hypothetical protein [Curtobacterium sp. MCPF17_031]
MNPVAAGPFGEPVTVTTLTAARGACSHDRRTDHAGATLPVLVGAIAAGVAWVRLSAAVWDVLQDEDAALLT